MTVIPPHPTLCTIRARWLFAMLVSSVIVSSVLVAVIWPEVGDTPLTLPGAINGLGFYVLLLAMLLIAVNGRPDRSLLGPIPSWRGAAAYASLGIPFIAVSIAAHYAVYLPLSYVTPELVSSLLFDMPPPIWWPTGGDPDKFYALVAANMISVLALVLVAPFVEESLFRGFLLNRWRTKYGPTKAVAFSSVAFGLLHVDVIGGIVFGVVLALIYLKTRSLIAPILVHMANNSIAIVGYIIWRFWYGSLPDPTLMEFRAHWWLAPLGALIGIPWLIWFVKRLIEGKFDMAGQEAVVDHQDRYVSC